MSLTFTDEQYQTMAINAIREYKNKDYEDSEITTLYSSAIQLVIQNIKNSLMVDKNIKQLDQGSRKTIYKDTYSLIDDSIKLILGKPYIRMYLL